MIACDLDQLIDEGRKLADEFSSYLTRVEAEFSHAGLSKSFQAMALNGFKTATGKDIAGWKRLNEEWVDLVESFAVDTQAAVDQFQGKSERWIILFEDHLDFAVKAPERSARFFSDEKTKAMVDDLFIQTGAGIIKRQLAWLRQMSESAGLQVSDGERPGGNKINATLGLVSSVHKQSASLAVDVSGLKKAYGDIQALDGVSLSVSPGVIYGLLGPNGAGKSTLIECLEGIRSPDSGSIKIFGLSYGNDAHQIKQRLGIQLQSTGFLPTLTVLETLRLYESFFDDGIGARKAAAWVDLEDKLKLQVRMLSGGQRQRLSLALAALCNPDILFLDEPTTGLDPHARKAVWGMINELQEKGKTIFLTTHYMEEAESLCDRLAILDKGRIIEEGTPAGLIKKHVGDRFIEFNFKGTLDESAVKDLSGVQEVWLHSGRAVILSNDIPATLSPLCADGSLSVTIDNLFVRRGTLEDVFLKLTNRGLTE